MRQVLAAVVFVASSGLGAAGEAVTLRTLPGSTVEGSLISLSGKEVVIDVKGSPKTTPAADMLDLAFPNNVPALIDSAYGDLELVDGTIVHCSQFGTRGDRAEIKLLSGLEVKLPLKVVSYYLNDAQDTHVKEEWQGLLTKRTNMDLLAVRDAAGKVNVVEGTFGKGDETGTSIAFEASAGVKRQLSLNRLHALAFVRQADVDASPVVCKVHDVYRDVIAATKAVLDGDHLAVTSVTGVQFDLPSAQIIRLDFSQGKLMYLSDMDPVKVVETSNTDRVEHYRRDKNLDDRPLTLIEGPQHECKSFAKGLALHAACELIYDIGGQYKEFKTLAGIDPTVGGDSHVKLQIEGDGQELASATFRRGEVAKPITCNVQNMRRLRIVVTSAGLLDLSNHINLAEARVSK
jgi:hypothetical protein